LDPTWAQTRPQALTPTPHVSRVCCLSQPPATTLLDDETGEGEGEGEGEGKATQAQLGSQVEGPGDAAVNQGGEATQASIITR
jgi:hypothetical protein